MKNRGNTPITESSDSSVFTASSDSDDSDTSNISNTSYISDQNSHSDDVNEVPSVHRVPIPILPDMPGLPSMEYVPPRLVPQPIIVDPDDMDHVPIPPYTANPVGTLPERTNGNAALYADILLLQMTLLESLETYTRENENRQRQRDSGPIIEEIVVSSDASTINDRGSNGSVD